MYYIAQDESVTMMLNLTSKGERQRSSFSGLITASGRFQEVLSYARRLSLYDFPVLIQGESGTQKKMLARAIHHSSSRRRFPFVSLNQLLTLSGCDLPEVLEAANHGTLLVDHIEKLSPKMQDFLVQLLQNTASDSLLPQRSWDIRVIATSAPNLYSLVQENAFQENLFFQLSTAVLDTVPLKERGRISPFCWSISSAACSTTPPFRWTPSSPKACISSF